MRNKNHHLKRRGNVWYVRYDIPGDLIGCFPERRGRTIEESLKTRDLPQARKWRDRRLRELENEWDRLRRQSHRSSGGAFGSPYDWDPKTYAEWAALVRESEDPDQLENFDAAMLNINWESMSPVALQDAQLALRVIKGERTLISAVADEWLPTKAHRNKSTQYTYRKAIEVLTDRFTTIEEVTHRDARNFLHSLLQSLAKQTVGQYCIAYRGIWEHLGKDAGLWSVAGMDSAIKRVQRQPWTDEGYLMLLRAAIETGQRDMFLAVRIAAHTGGAAQGIAGLETKDGGRSVFLPETKRNHRPRIIPVHSAIEGDVAEWVEGGRLTRGRMPHDAKSLSRKFGRLKAKLGYQKQAEVLHSFRHSAVYKLENAGVDDRPIKRLMGHYVAGVTFETYNAKGLGYEALKDVVEHIRWPEVVG